MMEPRQSSVEYYFFPRREVTTRIGRPQSFVAKYEGGKPRIDIVEFIAIAQALGHDPSIYVHN